ncbi:RNA polymerase sigma factor [Clostridium lundense]|uniref:RNA polymerase sigma factor n=1 Tax=Clostridium lundense TaxID=319475 RepID=UPI000480A565|nr:RNA polymerase sigma factor [Clostridium lundense]
MILHRKKSKDKLKHFNQLVPLIYKDVARYIFSITRNETLTEDVLQNTLIIAYENFSELKDIDKFKSWVLTIARRESIALIKKYKREVAIEDNIIEIMTDEDFSIPEQCVLKEELIDHVIKAINELRTEYRQVITLRYYNNLPLDEIATVLNISSSTARVWHMRAKKEVYNWIKDNYLQVDLKKKSTKKEYSI